MLVPARALPALLALSQPVGALHPDPGQARDWLQRELSRPEYHEGLRERFLAWLSDVWSSMTVGALSASGLSVLAIVFVVVVAAVVAALLVSRVRPEPGAGRRDGAALVSRADSPDELRAAAERALAAGELDRALVEAFRALATRAIGRGLVEERPGLTAHELADDLAPRFPPRAEALRDAATRFDTVFYGHLAATEHDARAVLDLDDALRRERPATGPGSDQVPTSAVPR
jgi:hypothetical protein